MITTIKQFNESINKKIRVSCSGLASIIIDDKYLLVQNRASLAKGIVSYGPLGGALEYLPTGKEFLDSLNVVFERETPDLRFVIDSNLLGKYKTWFNTTNDREKTSKREVIEELVIEEKILENLSINDMTETFVSVIQDKGFRFGVETERFFETYKITFTNTITSKLKEIANNQNSTIRLYTKDEILNDNMIAYHSRFIL